MKIKVLELGVTAAGITIALIGTKILESFKPPSSINPKPVISERATIDNSSKIKEHSSLDLNNFQPPQEISLNHAEAYYNQGLFYRNQNKWELAIAYYTKAIEIHPNYAKAYNNRGNIYRDLNQWNLAAADFNKAIEINPNYTKAYNNRGLLYKKQNQWDLAVADFNKAIEINPNYAKAYNNRGLIWIELGDKQRGIDDLQTATQLFELRENK